MPNCLIHGRYEYKDVPGRPELSIHHCPQWPKCLDAKMPPDIPLKEFRDWLATIDREQKYFGKSREESRR